jgi:hypothetical protein
MDGEGFSLEGSTTAASLRPVGKNEIPAGLKGFRGGGVHRFSYMGLPVYRGRLYRQFGLGRCKVHVDIPAHPTDMNMTAWFTTARGDDLDDTLERTTHQALTEFCERHLLVLDDTAIALLPVRNEGNVM